MTVNHDDLQRSLGRVEGNQGAMEARMDRFEALVSGGFEKVEKTLEAIDKRLAAIEARESERKGAWRAIVVISTTVSAVVAALVKYLLN
jgi:hypothetical protein